MTRKPTIETALSVILTDRPIAYHPILAAIGGGVQAGVFLSQLLYWTPRGKNPDGWIWKSKPDWQDETGMTVTEIDHARRDLKERGIIEEKLAGVPATIHYRADIARIAELLAGESQSTEETPGQDPDTENPSYWETRKLDTEKPGNLIPENPETSYQETQQLSIDYQRLPETKYGADAPRTLTLPSMELEGVDEDGQTETETDKIDGRAHFMALAEACSIAVGLATSNQKRQLGQSAKLLKKSGALPDDLARFRAWWDENDWRGKKGQPPAPAQVREEWGRFVESAGVGDGADVVRIGR